MNITLQYFDGCPNWTVVDKRLRLLATGRPDIALRYQLIDTVEEAERVSFHGSPTILVDGVDAFGDATASVGLACRIYLSDEGPAGAPSMTQLRSAIG